MIYVGLKNNWFLKFGLNLYFPPIFYYQVLKEKKDRISPILLTLFSLALFNSLETICLG